MVKKAVKLLNERKGTDLKIISVIPCDSYGAAVWLRSPTKFASAPHSHLMPLRFVNNWFDPDETVNIDLHAEYGKLDGDQKVLARLIFAIYAVWLGDGSTYAGLQQMEDIKIKKKASD